MARYIPIKRGQMQFPQNKMPIQDLQKGDMYLDDTTGKPMAFYGNLHDANDKGTLSEFVLLGSDGKIPSSVLPPASAAPVLTGRIVTIDKDNANATDTRTGLSKYDESKPFKTIQAAFSVFSSFDTFVIRRASTDYTENITLTGTGQITIIIYGATVQGGAGTTFNLSISGGPINIVFLGGGSIKNSGNAGDVENSANLRFVTSSGVNISSYGMHNTLNRSANITSTNSYAIKTDVSAIVTLEDININGKPTFSPLISINANFCYIGSVGYIANSTNQVVFNYCNLQCSSPTRSILAVGGGNFNLNLLYCNLSSGSGIELINYTPTSAGRILIKGCSFNNSAAVGTSGNVTINAGATTSVEITGSNISNRLGKTIEVIGGATGKALIAYNIINKAVTIATMPTVCDPIASNILTTDTLSTFPLSY